MSRTQFFAAIFAVVQVFVFALSGYAASDIELGRGIIEQYKNAVITVESVVKLKSGNREQEIKMDTVGTVIDANGLAVVSLSSIDPSAYYRNMGLGSEMQFESEITSMSFVLADGKELPAKEILRDNVLDLAYVRPLAKPETALTFIDMSDDAPAKILEPVLALNRLGKVANRVNAAAFEHIEAVVEKPRTFYVPSGSPTNTNQGCPVFNLEGKVVGVFVIRTIKSTGGQQGDNVAGIILPAADVRDGAQQAPPIE